VLILDADIQPRETMSSALIREYAELYRDGHTLAPITVFQEGQRYWVADGFHRVTAARQAGLSEIEVDLDVGTKREAICYSCGANMHGKTRSPEDKRRAVRRLLEDPEWRQWSNVEIARHCGVAQSFVSKIRRSLFPEQSDDHKRTYRTKHGTTATMDTSRIGRTGGTPATEEPETAIESSAPGDAAVRPEVQTPSTPVPAQVAVDRDDGHECSPEVLDTGEIPRKSIEATFPAIVESAAAAVDLPPQLETSTPQHEPSHVLRLMRDLCMAIQQRPDAAWATTPTGWSPKLAHEYLRTCLQLIAQLQALQRALEHHHLTTEPSPVGNELRLNDAGLEGRARQGDTSERTLATTAPSPPTVADEALGGMSADLVPVLPPDADRSPDLREIIL
jgi:transposase-like protein